LPDTVALNRLYSGTECAESVIGRQAPPWWHRLGGFLGRVCFRGILLSDAVDEAGDWGAAVHALALMQRLVLYSTRDWSRTLCISSRVSNQVRRASMRKSSSRRVRNTIGLRPIDPGSLVLGVLVGRLF